MNVLDKKMFISNLKFPNEFRCKFKGSVILCKLYKLAKLLNLDFIVLNDHSKIYYNDDISLSIDLAIYKILLTGKSWYNKYCFKSEGYDNEIKHNEKVRNIPLSMVISNQFLNGFDESSYPFKNLFNAKKMSFKEIAKYVSDTLNTNPGEDQVKIILDEFRRITDLLYSNYLSEDNIIKYKREPLILTVNDKETIEFYANEDWQRLYGIPFMTDWSTQLLV
jgi:hypothetical protein